MKNLKTYSKDPYTFYETVVDRKRDPHLKNRLSQINKNLKKDYDNYSDLFNKNNLILLKENQLYKNHVSDLKSLYSYQSKVIKSFREEIKDLQVSTIISTCQNCTINASNTLDHIIPQSNYPEFTVHPLNLFPCCSSCNNYKLNKIAKGLTPIFLNLYLDKLPDVQYLFLKIDISNKKIVDYSFYLANINNVIDIPLYNLIVSHFESLNLILRMKLKSIEYITELENRIKQFRTKLSLADIVSTLLNSINEDRKAYGYNYWKCILEFTLLNNKYFLQKFK